MKDLSQDLDIFVSNKKDEILEFGLLSLSSSLSPFRVLLLQLLLLQVVVFFFGLLNG